LKTYKFLTAVALFLLSACAQSPLVVNTAIPLTPTIIPVNTPSLTPENIAYAEKAAAKISAWLGIYTEFNTYHQLAMGQKAIFKRPVWKETVNGSLDKLSVATDELLNTQPVPLAMQNINENVIRSMKETKLMIEGYRTFLKENDQTMLDQINVHSDNALIYMRLAADELQPYLK
jgi:hypothetical protein